MHLDYTHKKIITFVKPKECKSVFNPLQFTLHILITTHHPRIRSEVDLALFLEF